MVDLNYRPNIEHERKEIVEADIAANTPTPDFPDPNDKLEKEIALDIALIDGVAEALRLLKKCEDAIWEQMEKTEKVIPPIDPTRYPKLHGEVRVMMGEFGMAMPGVLDSIPITRDLIKATQDARRMAPSIATFGMDIQAYIEGSVIGDPPNDDLPARVDQWQSRVLLEIFFASLRKIIAKGCFWIADTFEKLDFFGMGGWVHNHFTHWGNKQIKFIERHYPDAAPFIVPEQQQDLVGAGELTPPWGQNNPEEEATTQRSGAVLEGETVEFEANTPETARQNLQNNPYAERGGFPQGYRVGQGLINPGGGVNWRSVPGIEGLTGYINNWSNTTGNAFADAAPRTGPLTLNFVNSQQAQIRNQAMVINCLAHPEAITRWRQQHPNEEIPDNLGNNLFNDSETGAQVTADTVMQKMLLAATPELSYPDVWGSIKENFYLLMGDYIKHVGKLYNVILSWASSPQTLCCLAEIIKNFTKYFPYTIPIIAFLKTIRSLISALNLQNILDLNALADALGDSIKEMLQGVGAYLIIWLRMMVNKPVNELKDNMMQWMTSEDEKVKGLLTRCTPWKEFTKWLWQAIDMTVDRFFKMLEEWNGMLGISFGKFPEFNLTLGNRIMFEMWLSLIDQLIVILESLEACTQDQEGSTTKGINIAPWPVGATTISEPDINMSLDAINNLAIQRFQNLVNAGWNIKDIQRVFGPLSDVGKDPDTGKNVFLTSECQGAPNEDEFKRVMRMMGVHLNSPN